LYTFFSLNPLAYRIRNSDVELSHIEIRN